MFEIIQFGQDLVKFIPDAVGAIKVYEFGKQQYDNVKGFIGKKQMENVAALSANAADKLKDVAPDRLSAPSPSVLTPLIEGAMQESREELQELWASLLANSVTDGGKKVRRDYIEVVTRLEPIDARVLRFVQGMPMPSAPVIGRDYSATKETNFRYVLGCQQSGGIDRDDWSVSIDALVKLGCVRSWSTDDGGSLPELTPFGSKLLDACRA
jgi:hypothetical protein